MFMRKSTHEKRMLREHEAWLAEFDFHRQEMKRRVEAEYNLALKELSARLRGLLVDANYELFHSSDSQLRGRVYAFMANGLSMFHDKALKERNGPNRTT